MVFGAHGIYSDQALSQPGKTRLPFDTFYEQNLEHTPIEPRKKKQRPYFPSNPACLIRILIMGFQNPHIPGYYNPLYTQNNQGHYFCAQLDYSVVNIPHGAAFLSPIIGPTFIQKTKREFLRNPGIPIINNLPSLKPTWHLKKHPWKRRFLLETIIFGCYVSFREGIWMGI